MLIRNTWFFSTSEAYLSMRLIFYSSWRTLTIIIGLSSIPLYMSFWYLHESPRWLVLNGHTDKARKVLEDIAALNRRSMPADEIEEKELETTSDAILHLMSNRTLLKCFLILLLDWMVVCTLYYGGSLVLDSIPGSFSFKFICIVLIEVPGDLLCMFTVDLIGRKPVCILGFLVGGLGCLMVVFLAKHAALAMVIIGRFGAGGAFMVLYVYTVEQFPTSARNLILGASSLSARAGGVLAPQIGVLGRMFGPNIPFLIFGSLGILAGSLSFLLSETLAKPMPDVTQEVKHLIKSGV